MSACQWLGVAVVMASMFLFSRSFRTSVKVSIGSLRSRNGLAAPSNTFRSTSHSATTRTPLICRNPLMWLLPWPWKPTTARRMSSFEPGTCAQEWTGRLRAAVVTAELLRKLRRLRVFMLGSNLLRHHVGLAVITPEHFVGLVIADETFRLRIHLQEHAQAGLRDLEVDVVGLEMFLHPAKGFRGVPVAFDLLANLVRAHLLAETIGEVARVAKRAGKVAFENVRVQVATLPAAHGLDEILEMILGARPFLDLVALLVIGRRAGIVGNKHVAALAMDHDTDAAAFFLGEPVHILRAGLLRQAAHFKYQRRLGVIVIHDLRVRRLAIVLVPQPATDTPHARRQFVHAQEPPADVHLVNALVAQIAAAVVPDPMPVVVKLLAANRRHRGGATPQIVVHARRRRLGPFHLADAATRFVAQSAGSIGKVE